MIGVTTWIKSNVCRNVPFRRPAPAKYRKTGARGTGARGVLLGRQVDQLFKNWLKSGKIGKGRSDAVARARHAAAAVKHLRLRPVGANVFVSLNGIRTHLDGLAVDDCGREVVIELKSTQSTRSAHSADRNIACVGNPSTRFGGNTEHLHHRLQTAFGVHAHKKAAYGVLIVVCRDGAVTTTVPKSAFAASSFAVTAAPPAQTVVLFDWPAAAAAALPGKQATRSECGQHGLVTAGGTAVALQSEPSRATKPQVDAAKRYLASLPGPRYLVFPNDGRWRRRCIKQ
jgi:hypothetical protein